MNIFSKQPAIKNYWFGRSFRDLGVTIARAWKKNGKDIAGHWRQHRILRKEPGTWKERFVYNIKSAYHFITLLFIATFGSVLTIFISMIHASILLAANLIVWLLFLIMVIADTIYRNRNKIAVVCSNCTKKYKLPTYLCSCGREHTYLVPSIYGIWHRKCECGEKLPTMFFNGRKDLPSICPHCKATNEASETMALCIPIIGGSSTGKTAFIIAFLNQFINNVIPSKDMDWEAANDDSRNMYSDYITQYSVGDVPQTAVSYNTDKASEIAFNMFIKHSSFSIDRHLTIFDIAGETFVHNDENMPSYQYDHGDGIIFMLDPFSIGTLKEDFEEILNDVDKHSIRDADPNLILDSFISKLMQVTSLGDKGISKVPIAIVISKIDAGCLDQDLGARGISKAQRTNPDKFEDALVTQDYLCRNFLKENGMENFLNIIENRFKYNRFFACSAIGHSKGEGEYTPNGVLTPIEWIMQMADENGIGKIWHDTDFSKPLITKEEEKGA